jgi:hypothetical protein
MRVVVFDQHRDGNEQQDGCAAMMARWLQVGKREFLGDADAFDSPPNPSKFTARQSSSECDFVPHRARQVK